MRESIVKNNNLLTINILLYVNNLIKIGFYQKFIHSTFYEYTIQIDQNILRVHNVINHVVVNHISLWPTNSDIDHSY